MSILELWRRRDGADLVAEAMASVEPGGPVIDGELVDELATQDNLIAAGGWCAPSEHFFDFMDLPMLQVTRGGIRHDLV